MAMMRKGLMTALGGLCGLWVWSADAQALEPAQCEAIQAGKQPIRVTFVKTYEQTQIVNDGKLVFVDVIRDDPELTTQFIHRLHAKGDSIFKTVTRHQLFGMSSTVLDTGTTTAFDYDADVSAIRPVAGTRYSVTGTITSSKGTKSTIMTTAEILDGGSFTVSGCVFPVLKIYRHHHIRTDGKDTDSTAETLLSTDLQVSLRSRNGQIGSVTGFEVLYAISLSTDVQLPNLP